jgi:cytochrome P450 family 6
MLSGSTVEVKETMARFTTDVIASCVFGINANTLKDPDSEFRRHTRAIAEFSVQKGLAILLALFAPYLNTIFRLKFVGNRTDNYIRQIIWDTVQYR